MAHNVSMRKYEMSARMAEERARRARTEARQASEEADRLFVRAWNACTFVGRDVGGCPTVEMATRLGYRFLRVRCSKCRNPGFVYLGQPACEPNQPVTALTSRLKCERCRERGHRPGRAVIERLTVNRTHGLDDKDDLTEPIE